MSAKKNLLTIQLIIVLMGIGTGTTAPAVPLLGEELGASFSEIGFFMTGYSAAYAVMTIIAGILSDTLGRKKVLLFSLMAALLASTGYLTADSTWHLLLARTMEGLSWGTLWPVAEAIVADNTSKINRGKAMGKFSAFYGLGVACGSLTGGFLMQYVNLQAVLPVFPILSLTVIFTAIFGIAEAKVEKGAQTRVGKNTKDYLQQIKRIWPVCFAAFAYSGFLYSLWGLLSIIAKEAQVSLVGIGAMFALFWVSRLIFMLGAAQVQERFGSKKVLIAGMTMVTLSEALLISTSHFYFIVAAVVLGGLGTGIAFPIVITLVADSASEGFHGFALGFMELTAALGMIIQTSIAGILGEIGGSQLTYLPSFILCFAATLIIVKFTREPAPVQIREPEVINS